MLVYNMFNIDIIDKYTESFLKFLDSLKVPDELKKRFSVLITMSPVEKLGFISVNIKPYENNLENLMETIMKMHDVKLTVNENIKLKMFLCAFCELCN